MSSITGLSSGGRLGRFEIVGVLGAGGMGEVYRARDPQLRREVALKALPPELAADPQRRARLEREARMLASLDHPNIVTIYSVEEAEGIRFLTMELVEGTTLERMIPDHGFPLDRFFALAIPLADAVAAAHERRVVHRDLKPGNLMVTRDGRLKVLDFGLARTEPALASGELDREGSTDELTRSGTVVGTLPYMSPEQLAGKPADARSDIFSMGAVFYQMLTGERPFSGASSSELITAILRDTPPPVAERRPEVPRHLGRMVRMCLEKDPQSRYQAARDVANELVELRQERASEARGPSAATAASGPEIARRSRWRLPAAAAVLASSLALALPFAVRERDPPVGRIPVLLVLPYANGVGDDNEQLGVGFADSLITRLAGIPSLAVVSRAAVAEALRAGTTTEKLARDHGATYLLEIAAQLVGEQLRVNVNLVDAQRSLVRSSWEDGGSRSTLFELQRRLALDVSQALELSLSEADRRRLASPPTTDLDAFTAYSQARLLLQRPDLPARVEQGIALLERAIARDSSFALAHAALGDAYWTRYRVTGDTELAARAVTAIERAAELDGEDPEVRIALARVYEGTGRREEGIAQLRIALERHPTHDDAWRELGSALSRQGDSVQAHQALERAVSARPDSWRNHNAVGLHHYREGRLSDAIDSYRRAVALEPDHAWVLQNLGVAWVSAGETQKALEAFQRAVQLDPNASGAHSNIGVLYYQSGRFDEAAAAFERASQLTPTNPMNHHNRGDAYRRLERRGEAEGAYRDAVAAAEAGLALNPRDGSLLSLLALCQAKLERHEESAAAVLAALEASPADPTVHFNAAIVHALAGHPTAALEAVENAIRHGARLREIREEEDLATLRELPQFQRLVAERR